MKRRHAGKSHGSRGNTTDASPSIRLNPVRAILVAAVWLGLSAAGGSAPAQQESRIIDDKPYDLLVLKEGQTALKLEPLAGKQRRPLTDKDPDFQLVVRLRDQPDQPYQVTWKDVERLQLFEELVLEEAEALVKGQQFEEAYDYYLFLEQRDARFPGVAESFQRCLFLEASHWHRQAQFDQALSLLYEVHRRNSEYPRIEGALGVVADKLVQQHLDAGRPQPARQLIDDLARPYPDHDVVRQRRQQLQDKATELLSSARAAFEAGRMREAHQAATAATSWWPELSGGRQLRDEIHTRYPVLSVGVHQFGRWPSAPAALSWADRRQDRLLNRGLFEAVGQTTEGGRYQSPLGRWDSQEDVLRLELNESVLWSPGSAPLGAFDVVRHLLEMARRDTANYHAEWARVVASVDAEGPRQVAIRLRVTPPRWEPLLQARLTAWNHVAARRGLSPTNGPYFVHSQSDAERRYQVSTEYFAHVSGQPSEIVEERFPSFPGALRQLQSGRIVAYDRVPPRMLSIVDRYPAVKLQRYAAPTVHVLIPNLRKPLLADRQFRRALVYGINRPRILSEVLLSGSDSSLGQVLSGPFPRGYAYAETVAARPYDPRVMLTLLRESAERADPAATASTAGTRRTSLTLAYPPSIHAARACRAIQQQLQLNEEELRITLRELGADEPPHAVGDWDLLYLEWNMMEPVVDARRLLGSDGIFRLGDPLLDQLLDRVTSSESLSAAQKHLRAIHRAVHEDVTVIPLWQVFEHLAYHARLVGVGESPVSLYQNIEQWRFATVEDGREP